jgi:ferrochelatase
MMDRASSPLRPRVVLVNLGTPSAPTGAAVREFLREFLSDPLVVDWPAWIWRPILKGIVLRKRPKRVAKLYRQIWWEQCSPLEVETEAIRGALASLLPAFEVLTAYRYGARSLERVLPADLAPEPIWVVPLFPQRTSSSSGTIAAEVDRLRRARSLDLRICEIPPDDPGYVEAVADRVRETLAGQGVDRLLFSFHGIPRRYDRRERGRYQDDCGSTTAAVLARLGWPAERAILCYQSRFGPERWLGPATAQLLQALPRRGQNRVAVVTPGFLTEGLETLEEIGRLGRSRFLAAGGERFLRIPSVAAHPAFLRSLADLVETRHRAAEPQPERFRNDTKTF